MLGNNLQWTSIPSRKNRTSFANITDFYLEKKISPGKIYLSLPRVNWPRVLFFTREKVAMIRIWSEFFVKLGQSHFVPKSKTYSRFKPVIGVFAFALLFLALSQRATRQFDLTPGPKNGTNSVISTLWLCDNNIDLSDNVAQWFIDSQPFPWKFWISKYCTM